MVVGKNIELENKCRMNLASELNSHFSYLGAIYEGEFEDNVFHGEGILKYPNGVSIHGTWCKGVLLDSSSTLLFADGVVFREHDWQYCKSQDRR